MKKNILTFLACLASGIVMAQKVGTFQFGTKVNPEGIAVEVDSRGFIVDGQPVLPVMGELHYSRVPKEDWRREVCKMKAGGITILATYVFWNHHEEEEGVWNWNEERDLRAFLQICKEEKMKVVLRLGPFCHGEVYLGGMPEWLVRKAQENPKEYKLRSVAPGFMAAASRLYQAIGKEVSGMMWKDGGPIVGVQIENECRGPWPYFMALKQEALKAGMDVPFMTRTGWPKLNGKEEFGQLLPLYGDYADGFWDRKLTDMPGDYPKAFVMKDERMSRVIATETFSKDELKDSNPDGQTSNGKCIYPYLTCELGGGMMPSYHRRINISGNEAFPLAICKLGSGSNLPGYYMYHGGTNPKGKAPNMAECQASAVTNYNDMPNLSYDFQSPLGEMGQMNRQSFHQTRWLHQFLADWGGELSQMDVDTLSEHYARRGTFVFRNDYVRILNEGGASSVTPEGMKWKGLTISSETVQPFAKADGGLYFITIKGVNRHELTVNGKAYQLTTDVPAVIEGETMTLLSPERAAKAYVVDGKMHYSERGGILYCQGEQLMEESWDYASKRVGFKQTRKADAPRVVSMGAQKVAEQPSNRDFDLAACYTIKLPSVKDVENTFVEINYKGDCARLYADGELVEDNFWNGKPMLARMSQLAGKKVELRILPLGKDFPVYLQKEQRTELEKAGEDGLLSFDSIKLLIRRTERVKY